MVSCAPCIRHESRHPAPPSQTTAQLPSYPATQGVRFQVRPQRAQSCSRPTCCPMDGPYELDVTLPRKEGCDPRCLPRNRASRRQQTRAEALCGMRAHCSPCCCVNSRSFTASVNDAADVDSSTPIATSSDAHARAWYAHAGAMQPDAMTCYPHWPAAALVQAHAQLSSACWLTVGLGLSEVPRGCLNNLLWSLMLGNSEWLGVRRAQAQARGQQPCRWRRLAQERRAAAAGLAVAHAHALEGGVALCE